MRVVGHEGEVLGILPLSKALSIAKKDGLDLVEVAPNSDPPVCKVMDYGKHRYEIKAKAKASRKKQKTVSTKEIKIRPAIGKGDYDVKLRSINNFIIDGNRVKVSLKFRGREITHKEVGSELMERIIGDLGESIKVEMAPKMDGRQMIMIFAPA